MLSLLLVDEFINDHLTSISKKETLFFGRTVTLIIYTVIHIVIYTIETTKYCVSSVLHAW